MSLTLAQKILFFVLYATIIILIVFSATVVRGEEGFQQCMEKRCEQKGQEVCSKLREVSNCCLGASGQIALSEKGYSCAFA